MINKDFTIVIADDHPMLLRGLLDELNGHQYNVVAEAGNGEEALKAIILHKPTIALLDIDMPGLTGFEVVRAAREQEIATKFIVLSFHKEMEYVIQAKSLQIDGYLLKEDSFSEIENCMQSVLAGREFFSSAFTTLSLENVSEELDKLKVLTPSEKTILKLIAQGTSTAAIADSLFVSSRTIEKHRSNIKLKLGISGGANSLTTWCLTNKNIILDL